jgi:nitric oxide reductase NorQ protein/cobaltochelatase CobS
MDGGKVVVDPEESDETIIHDSDGMLEQEVGDPRGDTFGELPVLEDNGHPEVPREHETGYIRRRMTGGSYSSLSRKTDVQVVSSAMADSDFSTLLIGKHGVGKDKLILHICAKTNRPVIRLVANDDPDFIDLLVGTYQPNGDGDFVHKKGLLTIAIENGYTFVIDEFNALTGKVQTMLNMILESSDQNQLTIPETNEVIEPHEQFRFVATQNPNEVGYGGREDLDQATSSRFIPIEVPPLETSGEKKVVAGQTSWDENDRELDILLSEDGGVITGIRSLKEMGKVSTWVSTRDVIQIGRMAERLGDVQAAAELVLLGRASPEDKDAIQSNLQDQNW